jgi:hypothetical protein
MGAAAFPEPVTIRREPRLILQTQPLIDRLTDQPVANSWDAFHPIENTHAWRTKKTRYQKIAGAV